MTQKKGGHTVMKSVMKPAQMRMTEEQKLAQRAQIYMQKRESYALNAALTMLKGGAETGIPSEADVERIVEKSIYFADQLLEQLFKTPDEDKEDSDNEEDKR